MNGAVDLVLKQSLSSRFLIALVLFFAFLFIVYH